MKKILALTFLLLVLVGCNTTPSNQTISKNQPSSSPDTSSDNVQYLAYNQTTFEQLLGQKPFVLFFHAAWCPTCVNLEKQIQNNRAGFPAGSVIIKANYDTETQLKKDYGVTVQSTLIVFDGQGKETARLSGPSVDELQSAIAKTL